MKARAGSWRCWERALVLIFILLTLSEGKLAADGINTSEWDKNLLSVELTNVKIDAGGILGAWEEMSVKYLLRANVYRDSATADDQKPFTFTKSKTTGREIFEAFLGTYPGFTYTQDPETGIIWFHSKLIDYTNILAQRVRVVHTLEHIPAYTGIYVHLLQQLDPNVVDSDTLPGAMDPSTGRRPVPSSWLYDIDIPAGTYSAREILNKCCVANPSKAFLIQPMWEKRGRFMIYLKDLVSVNPLTPPRIEAVKFWEHEIGKSTNGTPSFDEIRCAMSDSNSMKRAAASLYVESSFMNYSPLALITNADSADKAVWTALGVQYAVFKDFNTNYFITLFPRIPRLREDLKRIDNPDLALLASLQLTREKKDTSYLDRVIHNHTYTEDEVLSVMPELIRMARASKAVRDKLTEMKSPIPELSQQAMNELTDTNSPLVAP